MKGLGGLGPLKGFSQIFTGAKARAGKMASGVKATLKLPGKAENTAVKAANSARGKMKALGNSALSQLKASLGFKAKEEIAGKQNATVGEIFAKKPGGEEDLNRFYPLGFRDDPSGVYGRLPPMEGSGAKKPEVKIYDDLSKVVAEEDVKGKTSSSEVPKKEVPLADAKKGDYVDFGELFPRDPK